MAKTIFGYEVASPEQQRKTALALLAFVGITAIAGMGVLFMISHWEQSGRQQAIAVIESFETKCRYVVRNISKRVSYYDHTGYIGCAEAHAVAKSNDNPLGSVQYRTVAIVKYSTQSGRDIRTSVVLTDNTTFQVGQKIEILYEIDRPMEASEFNSIPLFGKKSIAEPEKTAPPAQQTAPEQSVASADPAAEEPKARPSDSLSDNTKFWIGLTFILLMLAAAIWIIRLIYRLIKFLIFGGSARSTAQPIASDRLSVATGRGQKSFGRAR